MFFLVLGAWALTKATESGRTRMLLLAMLLVGVAFNTKLTAACVVLPSYYLVYLMAGNAKWWQRLFQLGAATVVLGVVALSWSVFVDLTPADDRAYVGDTQDNSMLTMAVDTGRRTKRL